MREIRDERETNNLTGEEIDSQCQMRCVRAGRQQRTLAAQARSAGCGVECQCRLSASSLRRYLDISYPPDDPLSARPEPGCCASSHAIIGRRENNAWEGLAKFTG